MQNHRPAFLVVDFRPRLDHVFVAITSQAHRNEKRIRRVPQFDARQRDIAVHRLGAVLHINQIRGQVPVRVSHLQRRPRNETFVQAVPVLRIEFQLAPRPAPGHDHIEIRTAVMKLVKPPVAAGGQRQRRLRRHNGDGLRTATTLAALRGRNPCRRQHHKSRD